MSFADNFPICFVFFKLTPTCSTVPDQRPYTSSDCNPDSSWDPVLRSRSLVYSEHSPPQDVPTSETLRPPGDMATIARRAVPTIIFPQLLTVIAAEQWGSIHQSFSGDGHQLAYIFVKNVHLRWSKMHAIWFCIGLGPTLSPAPLNSCDEDW